MKICVVVARFSFTGVPLTQIRFARALAARGHEVDLVFGHVPADTTLPDIGAAKLIVLLATLTWWRAKISGFEGLGSVLIETLGLAGRQLAAR